MTKKKTLPPKKVSLDDMMTLAVKTKPIKMGKRPIAPVRVLVSEGEIPLTGWQLAQLLIKK